VTGAPHSQQRQVTSKHTFLQKSLEYQSHGLSFIGGAGRNTTPLSQLMWKSTKDWRRFGWAWLAQNAITRVPHPHSNKDQYAYTPAVSNPENVQFILVGDTGINSPGELLVSSAISRQEIFPSDFLLLLGDVAYPAGSEADYRLGLLEAFRHYQNPILAIPGNHDWYDGLTAYERFFITGKTQSPFSQGYPWQCPKLPNWFYYMDIGKTLRILCLDTGLSGQLKENRKAQLAWLDQLLAASQDRFLVVTMHHPLYSLNAQPGDEKLRNLLEERFRQAGVRAVISGHNHNYQHHFVEGIHHIIAGAGGATLKKVPPRRRIQRPNQPDVLLKKPPHRGWDKHHSFLHCHWQDGRLRCQAWSAHTLPPEGRVLLDSFLI
jgi:hypothetical protein